jgi:DNA-binding response OmpR family regulator
MIERTRFHVVCADWMMSEMSGLAFFREVFQKDLEPAPCLILITAHTTELLEPAFARDRKNIGILRKPFNPVELVERVRHFALLARLRESTGRLRAAVRGGR